MRLLPKYTTLSVSNSAQATRGKLVMTLVLDRSGSMQNNGGSTALPPAVTTFVNYFDNANDEVAMVSYASNAGVDVAINYNFKTPITNAVNAMKFSGGTFGPGGLTLAKAQNDSVPVQPGQNVVKVIVYFTDGYVNEIQDTFNCPAAKLINYGGYDSRKFGRLLRSQQRHGLGRRQQQRLSSLRQQAGLLHRRNHVHLSHRWQQQVVYPLPTLPPTPAIAPCRLPLPCARKIPACTFTPSAWATALTRPS